MTKNEFLEKAKNILEYVKEDLRKTPAFITGALAGGVPAGAMIFLNHALDAFYRENASTATGVIAPMSPEVLQITMGLAAKGVGVAAVATAAILLAKGVISITDRLKELETIKFERGVRPDNPDNPKGARGAVKLSADQLVEREKLGANVKAQPQKSPLDAFYESQGYEAKSSAADAGAEYKKSTSPRLG